VTGAIKQGHAQLVFKGLERLADAELVFAYL
jgi:hypothetical protein